MELDHKTKKEIGELSQKVDRILAYLHNDQGTGELGLVAAFKDHKAKMDNFVVEYERNEAVKKGKMSMISLFFGAVGSCLALIAKWFAENWQNNH